MAILQLAGIALTVGLLVLLVREQKPVLAMLLTVAAGLLLLSMMLGGLEVIVRTLRALTERAQVQGFYAETLLKMIGIAYIGEFAAQTLRDANLESLAMKVELAAKLMILMLALPILQMILDTILKLLE